MELPGPWFLAAVAVRTAVVLLALLVGVRLLGKRRQMGDLNLLDVLMVLLIGNAIQNAITYGSGKLGVGIVSAATLLALDWLFGDIFVHRPGLERRVLGDPVVICTDGKLDRRAMRREGIDEDSVMTAARGIGVAELADVRFAIVEPDGTISIIPRRSTEEQGAGKHKK